MTTITTKRKRIRRAVAPEPDSRQAVVEDLSMELAVNPAQEFGGIIRRECPRQTHPRPLSFKEER